MIPIFKPDITDLEINAVTEVLKSGWLGQGKKVTEFEQRFAEYTGSKYAVALNSCTSALDLTLKAYGINNMNNAEVIVPALTFASTALAVVYNNAKVVFADIDEETLCIDWDDVKRKITRNTRAVIPVHYGGINARIDKEVALDSDITIIEDCAHAGGNWTVGRYNTSCWSFHAVKNLTTGDGGMITTDNEIIYEKLLPMRWCGINKSTWERENKKGYGWEYNIETIGYKASMNDIAAALGLAQLIRLNTMNKKRQEITIKYLTSFKNLTWLTLPPYNTFSSFHNFVIRLENRNNFIDYMLKNDISVGVHYKPLNNYSIFPATSLPVTDRVWKTLVTLPIYPSMTDDELDKIITTVENYNP